MSDLAETVARCETCGGDGFVVDTESYSEAAHAPDCQGYCRNCPIEVQAWREVQSECPDCGGTGRAALDATRTQAHIDGLGCWCHPYPSQAHIDGLGCWCHPYPDSVEPNLIIHRKAGRA